MVLNILFYEGGCVFFFLIFNLCLFSKGKVEMILPIAIGDYTDFFSSMHHAKNCGTIFRGPQNPITPNW